MLRLLLLLLLWLLLLACDRDATVVADRGVVFGLVVVVVDRCVSCGVWA